MFYSKNKRIYDLILKLLNENTQTDENGNPIVFDGNYMFKFNETSQYDHNFEIVSKDDDSLEFSSTEIVPFVDVQSIQVPYVELNKRDDYEREFYVAIKMPRTQHPVTGENVFEFSESNPQYQAVLETIENMGENLTFVSTDANGDDWKNSFKVKEPTKVGVFIYNGIDYQILAMTFNLTTLQKGFFGNETKVYLGLASDEDFDETDDYILDKAELNEITTKTTRPTSNVDDTDETKTADKRLYEANVTCNFNGNIADMLIYKEKACLSDLNTKYQLKITNKSLNTLAGENLDYTIDCLISNVNITYKNNMVDQLTFKIERA